MSDYKKSQAEIRFLHSISTAVCTNSIFILSVSKRKCNTNNSFFHRICRALIYSFSNI